MNRDRQSLSDATELRRRAEQLRRKRGPASHPAAAAATPEELTRELELRGCEVELLREELQASREWFHAAVDLAHDWESWFTPAGKLLRVSAAVERITGYTFDECLAMPDYPLPLIHPDNRVRATRKLRAALRGKPVRDLEFRIRRKDGSSGWCAVSWYTVAGRSGRALGIRACVRAIDKVKHVESAWQNSEARYRAIIESPIVAVGISRGEQVVYANAALLAIFGYDSFAEFARLPLLEHVAPSSREMIAERLEPDPVAGQQPAQFIYDIVRRDGASRTLAASSSVLTISGESYRFISVSDITGQRQVEKALRTTASLLQATLESTADGILVVDTAGRITGHNAKFMQMWKIPPAVLEARNDARALNHVLGQLCDPEGFMDGVRELYANPERDSFDTLNFKDGRVFDRYSQPQLLDERPVGRVWSFRDVTEQRRAERALREREERLHRIFAASPDAILVTDLQGSILTCNDSTVAIFGGGQIAEFIGCNLQIMLNGLTADPRNADLSQIVNGNAACSELTIVNRQARELIIEFSTVPLRDGQGRSYGRLWLGRNVTGSRALAREVLANQKRYKLLVEDIPAIVYIASGDNRALLEYISPQCEYLLGHPPGELLLAPQAWNRLVHPEDRDRVEHAYARFVHDGVPFCCEYRMCNREGGIIWFRDQIRNVYDQHKRVVLRQGVMVEISELKAAQAELDRLNQTLQEQVEQRSRDLIKTYADLCQQEMFFSSMVEETSDLIMVCDRERRITYCNRMATEILGCEPASLLGRSYDELLLPADLPLAQGQLRTVLAGPREKVSSAHYRYRRRNDRVHVLDTSFRVIKRLADNRQVLITCRDITLQRELEERQRAVQEKQAQLERLASLSALSAGIVHEINQPLQAIRVLVEGQLFWAARGKTMTQDDMRQALEGTMAQLRRVDEIVRHIRSFAALDQAVDTEACDLNAILQSALQLLGTKMAKHNISHTLALAWPLPLVTGNAHRLEEVIANLLLNAMQAYDQSEAAGKELRLRTQRDGDMVVLEVDDNATGIPAEHVTRIFEPLFTTKKASEGGMGLGLSLAQTVLGGYNGTIEAENNSRGGATFRMRLPALRQNEGKP